MKTSAVLTPILLISLGLTRADVITDWNSTALDAIRSEKASPPVASRALAILHVAMYDAVNGITRTHQPYLVGGHVPASASTVAAAATAGYSVLVALFPNERTNFDARYTMSLSAIPNRPQRHFGTAWGQMVASRVLKARAHDGSDIKVPYTPGNNPGDWVPTPPAFAPALLPGWGAVTPFGVPSATGFLPPAPPALISDQYASDLNLTMTMGARTNSLRTPNQTEIALFWLDGAGTATPPGHWNVIAQGIAAAQENSIEDNARLFALLNIAMADAAIVCWEGKYTYNRWRPITAIHNADVDGNPNTAPDTNWTSLIVTPPFPEYTSGHSTFSAAAAIVLASFFGTDHVSFSIGSDALPGVTRSFTRFSAAAEEAGMSRIYGGIHFMTANMNGLKCGRDIASYVTQHLLATKGNRSRTSQ
jgi:hypothetical protein